VSLGNQLLLRFSSEENVYADVQLIMENMPLADGWLYILRNKLNPNNYYITFNVPRSELATSLKLADVIVVHRKKDYNTIFTINALNQIQKQATGLDAIDARWPFPFDLYQNCILLYTDEGIDIIPTKIIQAMEVK